VGGWYDCGQLGTTLETNGILLTKGAAGHPAFGSDVKIVDPVLIEAGCVVENSTIGPNATIDAGTTVRDSTIRDSIVGAGCEIFGSAIHGSMLGDNVIVNDFTGSASIGSHSQLSGGD
jgi:glucose-1-phosphate thymidylyltransferase